MITIKKMTEEDFEYIWDLRKRTMKEVIENSYGWDEKQQKEKAKEARKGNLIIINNKKVGIFTVREDEKEMYLVWIAIEAEYRNKGIGKEIIKDLIEKSTTLNKELTLIVLVNNPAIHLYKKMGFEIEQSIDQYRVKMKYKMQPNSMPASSQSERICKIF